VFERLLRNALLSFDRWRSAAVDGHEQSIGPPAASGHSPSASRSPDVAPCTSGRKRFVHIVGGRLADDAADSPEQRPAAHCDLQGLNALHDGTSVRRPHRQKKPVGA